jgi:glycosyltransferase involved in cell wall biosynthesis
VIVRSFPAIPQNPYQQLLARELEARGARVEESPRLRLGTALRADPGSEVLHLHWQDLLTRADHEGPKAAAFHLVAAVHLLVGMAIARARGVRTVWTVHNLEPHESRRPLLDRLLACSLARLATSVVVHSEHAARVSARRLRRRDLPVAHHGNYLGFYPPPARGRSAARERLGIAADAHVFLAFGQVRPYKRIPELIAAFRSLASPAVHLVVAGNARGAVREEVTAAAAGAERVTLLLEPIDDAEVRELHAAADTAVIAYEEVLSSGALLLALSCGVPVVAPADSTATELAPPPAVAPYPPGGLAATLAASVETPPGAGAEALAAAERYGWGEMAAAVLGAGRR